MPQKYKSWLIKHILKALLSLVLYNFIYHLENKNTQVEKWHNTNVSDSMIPHMLSVSAATKNKLINFTSSLLRGSLSQGRGQDT